MEKINFDEYCFAKKKIVPTIKTTIQYDTTNGLTIKCSPNDVVYINFGDRDFRKAKREECIKFFMDEIRLGDNLEVEQGAYGLFDTLGGSNKIETEF